MYLHLPMYDWMNALGTITSSWFLNLLNFRLEFFSSSFHTSCVLESWTSPTHSPLPNGLFTSSMHYPWVSRTPSMGTPYQPRMHIHGNPARLCPWEPRTTPLFSTISNIPLLGFSFLSFFFRIFVCGPFRLSLSPLGRDHKHITTFATHHHGLWYHLLGK